MTDFVAIKPRWRAAPVSGRLVRKWSAVSGYGVGGYTDFGLIRTCTDHQIAAITGHKSLSMIQKNSHGASQKILAKQAKALREQNKT
jgi:hypothetical protein